MIKITGQQLIESYNEWQKGGARKGTHLRFGQYVMNNLLPSVVDPLVYYCESTDKAYKLLWERYCEE